MILAVGTWQSLCDFLRSMGHFIGVLNVAAKGYPTTGVLQTLLKNLDPVFRKNFFPMTPEPSGMFLLWICIGETWGVFTLGDTRK